MYQYVLVHTRLVRTNLPDPVQVYRIPGEGFRDFRHRAAARVGGCWARASESRLLEARHRPLAQFPAFKQVRGRCIQVAVRVRV